MTVYKVLLHVAGQTTRLFFSESKRAAEEYVQNIVLPPYWTRELVEKKFDANKHKLYTSEGLEVFSVFNPFAKAMGKASVTIEKGGAL